MLDYNRTVLQSGIRVLTTPMASTKTVSLVVLIGVGSEYEEKDRNGISHFLEHLFFKGTTRRPTAFDVVRELDGVGAEFNAFTANEVTGYFVHSASPHFDLALDVLADILHHSTYPADELENERKVIIEELNVYFDTPTQYVMEIWPHLLWGDQPAGWPVSGTKESVSRITRGDILRFVNAYYLGENTVVSLAGGLPVDVLEKVRDLFLELLVGARSMKTPPQDVQTKPALRLEAREIEQANVMLGFKTFGAADMRKYALKLLATILGGNMSSRLFTEVRQKRGLAYAVQALTDYESTHGFLAVKAGVNAPRIDEALRTILNELKKCTDGKVSEEELARAKEFVKGRALLGLEEPLAVAENYAIQELTLGEIMKPEEEFTLIDAVTADDVLRVAQDIFRRESLNLALVGPFHDEAPFQKLLEGF